MGLIGCRLFEDEVVHVLSQDKDMDRVILVDDEESQDLERKLLSRSVEVTKIKADELPSLRAPPGLSALVWIKPMALHQKPEKLREDILGALGRLGPLCHSILLFYGLCGNAFRHVEKDTSASSVPGPSGKARSFT